MNVNIHGVENLRVASYSCTNSNQISLEMSSRKGDVEITLYGLPQAQFAAIVSLLSDNQTRNYSQFVGVV